MELEGQRASTLVEAAVAVAIVAVGAGAMLGAAVAAAHWAGGDPVRDALQDAAQREMRVALDVLKYRDASVGPAAVATTLPMPTGSPLPAQLSIVTSNATGGAIDVTITASETGGSAQRVTLSGVLNYRAPLPGAQMDAPGLVAAPTGAP